MELNPCDIQQILENMRALKQKAEALREGDQKEQGDQT
jgi:hypothetical protein